MDLVEISKRRQSDPGSSLVAIRPNARSARGGRIREQLGFAARNATAGMSPSNSVTGYARALQNYRPTVSGSVVRESSGATRPATAVGPGAGPRSIGGAGTTVSEVRTPPGSATTSVVTSSSSRSIGGAGTTTSQVRTPPGSASVSSGVREHPARPHSRAAIEPPRPPRMDVPWPPPAGEAKTAERIAGKLRLRGLRGPGGAIAAGLAGGLAARGAVSGTKRLIASRAGKAAAAQAAARSATNRRILIGAGVGGTAAAGIGAAEAARRKRG